MATKDYLKFRNAIKKDSDLTLEEAYLLEVLYDYHNTDYGYAFPPYELLMQDLKTNRRAKVSKLLKALVSKGFIRIDKNGRSNKYFILKYLFIDKIPTRKYPVDSNGDEPMNGQVHFEDKDLLLIEESTGFTKENAVKLIKAAKNDIKKVIKSFDYAKSKNNVKDIFKYTLWAIKTNIAYQVNIKVNTKFNNFEPRKYDYEKLERQLLGWDDADNSYDLSFG